MFLVLLLLPSNVIGQISPQLLLCSIGISTGITLYYCYYHSVFSEILLLVSSVIAQESSEYCCYSPVLLMPHCSYFIVLLFPNCCYFLAMILLHCCYYPLLFLPHRPRPKCRLPRHRPPCPVLRLRLDHWTISSAASPTLPEGRRAEWITENKHVHSKHHLWKISSYIFCCLEQETTQILEVCGF